MSQGENGKIRDAPPHVRKYMEALHLQRKAPFKLKPHHAKPYRKRHVLGLGLSIVAVFASLGAIQWYIADRDARQNAANVAVLEQQINTDKPTIRSLRVFSTLGFELTHDSATTYATATAGTADDQLSYSGSELADARPYGEVLYTIPVVAGQKSYGSMLVMIDEEKIIDANDQDAKAALARDIAEQTVPGYEATILNEATSTYNNTEFNTVTSRLTPVQASSGEGDIAFQPRDVETFVGVLPSGHPLIIRITIPDASPAGLRDAYVQIFESIRIGAEKYTSAANTQLPVHLSQRVNSWAQNLGLAPAQASAESLRGDSSRLVSQNAPAVVKVYHISCGAITYRGEDVTGEGCVATTGSGFFVSADGYIATNGHVVVPSVKDTIVSGLTPDILSRILQIDGYSSRDIADIVGRFSEGILAQSTIYEAIYQLPENALSFRDQQDMYIVSLGTRAPDIEYLSRHPESFKETVSIKEAELIGVNYAAEDLYNESGFSHSDVALLKVGGENYPVVSLGSVETLVQGDPVTVIGFPSDAEQNPLIRGGELQTTATQGIVSAIREVNGNNKKVVQSDVNIGHGNSGGPALASDGLVFGLATYVLSGENGSAGITFIRDIQDLRSLASRQNIMFDDSSETQDLWSLALDDFYSAHYTAAVDKFRQVKKLYPPHATVDSFISIANTKIANGEEAVSPLVPLFIVVSIVISVSGVVMAVVLISRHRAHHHLYRALKSGYLHGPFSRMLEIRHQH